MLLYIDRFSAKRKRWWPFKNPPNDITKSPQDKVLLISAIYCTVSSHALCTCFELFLIRVVNLVGSNEQNGKKDKKNVNKSTRMSFSISWRSDDNRSREKKQKQTRHTGCTPRGGGYCPVTYISESCLRAVKL